LFSASVLEAATGDLARSCSIFSPVSFDLLLILVHCLASIPTALCWANVFHLFWTPVSSGSIQWPIPSLATGAAVHYRVPGQRLRFSACCANIFAADFSGLAPPDRSRDRRLVSILVFAGA
jgi:hypothetical protein